MFSNKFHCITLPFRNLNWKGLLSVLGRLFLWQRLEGIYACIEHRVNFSGVGATCISYTLAIIAAKCCRGGDSIGFRLVLHLLYLSQQNTWTSFKWCFVSTITVTLVSEYWPRMTREEIPGHARSRGFIVFGGQEAEEPISLLLFLNMQIDHHFSTLSCLSQMTERSSFWWGGFLSCFVPLGFCGGFFCLEQLEWKTLMVKAFRRKLWESVCGNKQQGGIATVKA